MFAGVSDDDFETGRSFRDGAKPVVCFIHKGVRLAARDIVGKTVKIVSSPIEGSFMVEIVENF